MVQENLPKVLIGKVSLLIHACGHKSSHCHVLDATDGGLLYQNSDKDLTELGECPNDQGAYFIINWSGKGTRLCSRTNTRTLLKSVLWLKIKSTESVRMLSRAGAKVVCVLLHISLLRSFTRSPLQKVNQRCPSLPPKGA